MLSHSLRTLAENLSNESESIAVIRREDHRGEDEGGVLVLQGPVRELDRLDDIPVRRGTPKKRAEQFDTLSILPFSQVQERGFGAHDDGAKILCMDVQRQQRVDLHDLLRALPGEGVALSEDLRFDTSDEDYEGIVRQIVKKEIGGGEGSNFVISRAVRGRIADMSRRKALSVYENLLRGEYGSYWTYLYATPGRTFIGATPEPHIIAHGGDVEMRPISGTFRKPRVDGDSRVRSAFEDFLRDEKEIDELNMVTDEELKLMAVLCDLGGRVMGPYLREMARVIHTEYRLVGRSTLDVIQLLRGSMFAATVTGSPVENACRIIRRYEAVARRYYASALALIGRDAFGAQTLDSPITIRGMEVDREGNLEARVGASLVRDSDPHSEMLETWEKISSVLSALKGGGGTPARLIPDILDADLELLLVDRNRHLSKYWPEEQGEKTLEVPELVGKRITLVDNEDDFCHMMAHMLKRMGAEVRVVRHSDFRLEDDNSDLLVEGPGPGDPCNMDDGKIRRSHERVRSLLQSDRKFLSVCLGHQVLCAELGMDVRRKKETFQGVQKRVNLFGKRQRVGFYNTFSARTKELDGVEVSTNDGGEVNAVRGRNFTGIQFHPESRLTENGFEILRDIVVELLGREWRQPA